MHPVARVRHLVARRPWIYWTVVAAVAAGAALFAAQAVGSVDDARRAWGTTQPVVVAVADLAPGDAVIDRTQQRSLPAPVVPARALHEVPPDAIARQHVAAGEVLVDLDVAAGHAPVALIPDGWHAVPVAEEVPTGAVIGDRVVAASGGVVVAGDGVVVGQGEGRILVAVPAGDAPAVAMAASTGELTLLLVG